MDKLVWILSGLAIINYMAFGKDLGNFTSELMFDNNPEYSVLMQAVNLLVMIVAAVALYFLTKVKKEILTVVLLAGTLAFGAMSISNMNKSI